MARIHHIPLGLTLLRALLGPVVLALAMWAPNPALFAACLIVAFLSDVFDGIIARRLKVATANIRRMDSIADSVFYVCTGIAAYLLYPQALRDRAMPLLALITLELARYGLDYLKYRRETSYHMWSSKAWGICLFLGFLMLLGWGQTGLWLSLAIYAGIVADIEGLLISLVLPTWQHDVPSLVHALRLRQQAHR
jgi:CDP-diacylglycerol--glycerol-3-phosphate 3-phosphatidyltransferase